jgi:hypothetical protein
MHSWCIKAFKTKNQGTCILENPSTLSSVFMWLSCAVGRQSGCHCSVKFCYSLDVWSWASHFLSLRVHFFAEHKCPQMAPTQGAKGKFPSSVLMGHFVSSLSLFIKHALQLNTLDLYPGSVSHSLVSFGWTEHWRFPELLFPHQKKKME